MSDNIFIDYRGEKVRKLVINDLEIWANDPFHDHRIDFPKDFLLEGRNEVSIRFATNIVGDN